MNQKVNFSAALFWDIDLEFLDVREHSRFIIERVITRGAMQDWNLLKALYGKEKIKKEAQNIRYLDKKSISFLSAYFNVNKVDFRCCN